jgi:antitoxin MazE
MYTYSMRARLTQWGNSLGVRIPKVFAVQMGMSDGSEVDVALHGSRLVVSQPLPSLKKLLRSITPSMLHGETQTGHVTGREVW